MTCRCCRNCSGTHPTWFGSVRPRICTERRRSRLSANPDRRRDSPEQQYVGTSSPSGMTPVRSLWNSPAAAMTRPKSSGDKASFGAVFHKGGGSYPPTSRYCRQARPPQQRRSTFHKTLHLEPEDEVGCPRVGAFKAGRLGLQADSVPTLLVDVKIKGNTTALERRCELE